MIKTAVSALGLALTGSLFFASAGHAEESNDLDYPTKNLSITVPYAAGGIADVISRRIASYGDDYFGQSMVVQNRTGAGGTIAATVYLQEQPNTHDIMLASRSIFATIPLFQNVAYSYDDFEPIIGIESVPFVVYVNPNRTNIHNIAELIEYGQQNTIKYGTTGLGSDIDLIQSGLFAMADVAAEAVVYGGAKEAVTNVAAGHIDVAVAPPPAGMGFMEEGTLIPLAVAGDDPYEGFNDITVPTLREEGYDISYPGLNFYAIRKGTDPEIVQFLYDRISEVYQTEEFIEFSNNMKLELEPLTPEQIDSYMEQQIETATMLKESIDNSAM